MRQERVPGLGDLASNAEVLASLFGSRAFELLVRTARQEVEEEKREFDPALGDHELAVRVRQWAAKMDQLSRLEGIINQAAQAAKETR